MMACVKSTPAEISGRRMIEARKAAGLTQVVVARRLAVDQTQVSRLELGKVVYPPLQMVGRYCEIVGCDWRAIVEPYFEQPSTKRQRLKLERAS
jgi:transcriptional regulator with XRE-family HTH domain